MSLSPVVLISFFHSVGASRVIQLSRLRMGRLTCFFLMVLMTVDVLSPRVNIVSLGAGFGTLFFRLMDQRTFAGMISFTEIDCDTIVTAKTKLLNDSDIQLGLFPKDIDNLIVALTFAGKDVAWQCQVLSGSYSLIACNLGDIQRLDAALQDAGVERQIPTLVLGECVLSYLAPERGTTLLEWLAATFSSGSIALYDLIGLQASKDDDSEQMASTSVQPTKQSDAFGSTLQRYFAAKGCTLRGVRGYRTAADHCRRLLAYANWKNCCILDMNGVFAACTTTVEKHRLALLEPFDEYADWAMSNAHYAIYLADNCKDPDMNGIEWITRFVPHAQQHRYLLIGNVASQQKREKLSEPVIIRSFQRDDLAIVRSLFESTRLELLKRSRAVCQFVANRLHGPSGDMFDIRQAFQTPNSTGMIASGFWVAEVGDEIVGCVGLKPLMTSPSQHTNCTDKSRSAELCRLSVAPVVRRSGVASALVQAVEAFAVSCRVYDTICLDTLEAMEAAQHLYRALGYVEQPDHAKQHSTFELVRFQKTL